MSAKVVLVIVAFFLSAAYTPRVAAQPFEDDGGPVLALPAVNPDIKDGLDEVMLLYDGPGGLEAEIAAISRIRELGRTHGLAELVPHIARLHVTVPDTERTAWLVRFIDQWTRITTVHWIEGLLPYLRTNDPMEREAIGMGWTYCRTA